MNVNNSAKGYIYAGEKLVETGLTGMIQANEKSAFAIARARAISEGLITPSDKTTQKLYAICFENSRDYEYCLTRQIISPSTDYEMDILVELEPFVYNKNNLPLILAISTNRSIDKILEQVGFVPI